MNTSANRIVVWLVILSIPVFLALSATRLLVSEAYPRFEYAKPDFPADAYGFTQAERLELATVAIRFLNVNQPPREAIKMLEAQTFPGSPLPLYADYELSHMVDVKVFIDKLWRVHLVSTILVLGGMLLLALRGASRRLAPLALKWGGLLTAGLLTALAAFVLLSWRTFFIQFHELFFNPGTWTFDWSSSLIRLFPDRFWFDGGTLLTVGTLMAGILVALVGLLWQKRPVGEDQR